MFNQVLTASIIAFVTVLSAFGAGFLCGHIFGTSTPNRRFTAAMIGLVTGFMVMGWMFWIVHHGVL